MYLVFPRITEWTDPSYRETVSRDRSGFEVINQIRIKIFAFKTQKDGAKDGVKNFAIFCKWLWYRSCSNNSKNPLLCFDSLGVWYESCPDERAK